MSENEPNKETKSTENAAPANAGGSIASAFANAVSRKDSSSDDAGRREDAAAHAKSVEAGRLRKMSEENRQLREQLAEIRHELQELRERGASPAGTEGGASPEDDALSAFDDETKKSLRQYFDRRERQISDRFDERLGQIEERAREGEEARTRDVSQRTIAAAGRTVEERFPGLLHRVGDEGGDLVGAWKAFNATVDAVTGSPYWKSLNDAARRGAPGAVVRVFEEFVRANGLAGQFNVGALAAPPSGAGPAAPTASQSGGVKKLWPSRNAIYAEMDRVRRDAYSGRLSREEKLKQLDELESAIREKRYAQEE